MSESREILDTQRDPDFTNAFIALKRAAKRARVRAGQVGGRVVIYRDGEIVEEDPEILLKEGLG